MREAGAEMCWLCSELAGARDLSETLDLLARNITEIMGAKGSAIRLLDAKRQTLRIAAVYGLSREFLEKGEAGEREGIGPVLSVPLQAGEKTIGLVSVHAAGPHEFKNEETGRLKALASLGGILVDRARIGSEMSALVRITRSISSTLSLDEVLNMIVESAAETLGMKGASIRLLDEERKSLRVRAAYGLSREYLDKGPVEVDRSPIDRECLQCRLVEVSDIRNDGRLQYPEEIISEGIAALLSLPLVVRGRGIGVLRVYTSVPYAFDESERDFLSALACQGAIAIENARLFEHIQAEYRELTRDVWRWYDWGERFPKV